MLLVDDSIVRGTTCGQIIQMARDAGAKEFTASAAPPVRHPNVYGIDMPAANELIAHGRSVEEIRAEIGADWLVYQDLEDLLGARERAIQGWMVLNLLFLMGSIRLVISTISICRPLRQRGQTAQRDAVRF